MKKKLGKLNKKIRHSKRKHNNLVSKQNSIKKIIKELKGSSERNEVFTPERSFSTVEHEQAFRAYRSYRINGRSRMDLDTFFDWIRQNLIYLISRELTDVGSATVQTTAWIRVTIEYEDGIIDRVKLPFNSQMTDIFQGSDLNKIVNGMFAHMKMKMQIKNPALANSRFRSDEVLLLDINFHQLNLTRGCSYLPLPDWMANKRSVVNHQNESDKKCFKWAVTATLPYVDITSHPEHISNLRKYVDNYD